MSWRQAVLLLLVALTLTSATGYYFQVVKKDGVTQVTKPADSCPVADSQAEQALAAAPIKPKAVSRLSAFVPVVNPAYPVPKFEPPKPTTAPITIPKILSNPAVSAAEAAQNIRFTLPDEQAETRYISMYHVPQERLGDYRRCLDGALQQLSFQKLVKLAEEVPGTHGRLYRIRLSWYGWSRDAWEKLAAVDYAFNDQWLPHEEIKVLKDLTVSNIPIVKCDTIMAEATINDAIYAGFLNLGKNEPEFLKRLGANFAKSRILELGAVVHSPVTNHNRKLARVPTTTSSAGYLWVSLDTLKNTEEQNVMSKLFEDYQDAGREEIASLPNGWQCYGVFQTKRDDKNKAKILDQPRLAAAPIAIAHDWNFPDNEVKTARSCIVCHFQDAGLRRFENVIFEMASKREFDAYFKNEKDLNRALEQYGPSVYTALERDRDTFSRAVFDTVRMTPAEYGSLYYGLITKYFDEPVKEYDAIMETGLEPDQLKYIVRQSGDNNLSLLYGEGMERDQWKLSMAEIMRLRILVVGR